MAKLKRPFQGMRGAYVLATEYNGTWVAHLGSNDPAVLRAERRRLSQWPDSQVHIFPNNPGDPKP